MKTIKAVLYGNKVKCPCCGSYLTLGATVRLKGDEIGQDKLDDYKAMPDCIESDVMYDEEAERDAR